MSDLSTRTVPSSPSEGKDMTDIAIRSPTGEIVFAPHPGAQTAFFTYNGRYALTGGSAGGGKSQCLLFYPFRQIASEAKRIERNEITSSIGHAIYFRRTMPEVQEMIDRSRLLFLKVDPGAEWREQPKTWTFSSGYKYKFAQMEEAKDWIKYYGTQYSAVMFDELTTFTEEQYDMLDTRLRSPDEVLSSMLWMRAGTNPVGIGLQWVKKRFVDAGRPNEEVVKRISVDVKDANGIITKQTIERRQIFIPARLSDNPSINQAEYAATLSTKSDGVRRALLEGDWGSMTGDLIGQVWDEPVHVVRPAPLVSMRARFRVCHFSYVSSFVLWLEADTDGNLTVYRDLWLKNHTAEMVANRIRELEEEAKEWEPNPDDGSKLHGFLGPASCWAKSTQRGPSQAETMRRIGVRFRQADENLSAAVDQIRTRLLQRTTRAGSKLPIPGIRFWRSCTDALESIPSMPAHKDDPDLPDPKAEGSAYRALCYAAMSRPIPAEKTKVRDELEDEAPRRRRVGRRTGMPGGW